ncbi:hypothetical protein D1872_331190 [compost metagenome]
MQYLIGALATVAFFVCLYGAYKAGQRSRKTVPREIDEQEAQRAKQLRKGFDQLMGYDVSKALGKKVT